MMMRVLGLLLLLALSVSIEPTNAFAPMFGGSRFCTRVHSSETTTEKTTPLISVDFERKEMYKQPDRPYNDLMIRAALGEKVERTPVWLFRQAGRHLPEYHEYKDETNKNFLEMIGDEENVAECTMMPLRRYDVDAAILFSDILVVAEALSTPMYMPGGQGITIPNPIANPGEVDHRLPKMEEITEEFVASHLGYVMNNIVAIRKQMEKEDIEIPLIGFSGAPYTLMYYMLGGSSKKNNEVGMEWLQENEEESIVLLKAITKVVVEYLSLQVEAGAHMLQLFEAMGMMIDEEHFNKFALPCLEIIATELKARFPDVPLMVFARGASFANKELSKLGFDVLTMDGSLDRSTVRDIAGDKAIQGDVDPAELIAANDKTVESVQQVVKGLLQDFGPQKLIANLGEGLGGKEDPTLVKTFVNTIHAESAKMIQNAKEEEEE